MIRRLKRPNERGDTIIEVLIVLAVIGLALGMSFATANKGLNQSQNSQEHSYALGLLETQVEMLRSAVVAWSNSTGPTAINPFSGGSNIGFCLTSPTVATPLDASYNPASTGPSGAQFNDYPNTCQDKTTGATYYESIVYNNTSASNPYFDLIVRWSGVGGLGVQQEELSYKMNSISLADSSTINISSSAPSITVAVHEIPLTGPSGTTVNPTPSCSNAISASGVNGVTIVLSNGSGSASNSTSGGTVIFQGLTDNDTYSASITGLPSGYQLCSGGGNASVPAAIGSTTATPNVNNTINASNVDIAVRPVCTPQTIVPAPVITGWIPNYTNEITGWIPNYTNEITGWSPNYSYYWSYIGTWYTSSNTTYIGVYAKYNDTTAGPSTLGWVAWMDPYNVGYHDWAWDMYQVDDYISSYTPIYTEVITSYTPIYTEVITSYTPIYTQPPSYTIYNCPSS